MEGGESNYGYILKGTPKRPHSHTWRLGISAPCTGRGCELAPRRICPLHHPGIRPHTPHALKLATTYCHTPHARCESPAPPRRQGTATHTSCSMNLSLTLTPYHTCLVLDEP